MRFYSTILLAVMVLNIGKYQIPYIKYNLFKDYIVENLCVQRNEEHNCCQGKCHLEKQIQLVNETEEDLTDSPTGQKPVNINEIDNYIVTKDILQHFLSFIEIRLSTFTYVHITKISVDIPVPPPKRFI